MRFINSISLTPAVTDWLIHTHHPHILHIFDRACNLINEHKEVLSIVTPQIWDGPFNLVIEDDVCFAEHINLKSPVSNSPHQLTLGDLTIHTTGAEPWNPRPNWKLLHSQKGKILSRLIQLPITNHPPTNPQFSNSLISNLCSSLITANVPTAKSLAAKLAGLGIGLTPSGDDVLMGALYAAWIIHPPEIASVLGSEVAETASALTTSLSAAWLKSAGRGEAGSLWHQFFDAMLTGEDIQSKIKNILAVGHTSGADVLTGFMGVLTCWNESTNKETAVL